jgi:hypothetical protein
MCFLFLVVIFLPDSNYPFLTPREKKTEFRKQETNRVQNEGVETR